jgi:CheY-like chemotaxis protein
MDGYALMRKIRQLSEAEHRRIPAVAITAYARGEDRIMALSAGFQAHLPKPVDPADLTRAVSSLVRSS